MNLYQILNISNQSNILEICNSYQKQCIENPKNTFICTIALSILCNKSKRFLYDSSYYKINLETLSNNYYIYENYYNIDEYELIPFIEWIENFKDFFYDSKYYYDNSTYHELIEKWYDTIEIVIETLKNYIKNFYLA